MGTVSKTLASGLRLGWMVVPPALRAEVLDEKLLTGRGAPALDQLALAALIESGRYDRHLRRMRATYTGSPPGARRRAGRRTPPASRSPGSTPAVTVCCGCRTASVSDEVVAATAARGVQFYGMSRYRADGAARRRRRW